MESRSRNPVGVIRTKCGFIEAVFQDERVSHRPMRKEAMYAPFDIDHFHYARNVSSLG